MQLQRLNELSRQVAAAAVCDVFFVIALSIYGTTCQFTGQSLYHVSPTSPRLCPRHSDCRRHAEIKRFLRRSFGWRSRRQIIVIGEDDVSLWGRAAGRHTAIHCKRWLIRRYRLGVLLCRPVERWRRRPCYAAFSWCSVVPACHPLYNSVSIVVRVHSDSVDLYKSLCVCVTVRYLLVTHATTFFCGFQQSFRQFHILAKQRHLNTELVAAAETSSCSTHCVMSTLRTVLYTACKGVFTYSRRWYTERFISWLQH